MDYKKIIKNQETRFKILKLLNFIPDKTMLKLQYRIKTGRKLNLKNPKRYTEKIQWYKLNYRTPLMTKCADKYTVREYIESKGLGDILNELYGVYDSVEEIDFEKLPNKFVLKTTNDSHTNIFCNDKENSDIEEIKKELNYYMKSRPKISLGREWVYKNSKRRIICEKLLERDNNGDLPDYKFFCFNGKVYCLYVMIDYVDNNAEGKLEFYDRDFKDLNARRKDFKKIDRKIEKPKNFERMVEYAEILSKDFPHVRVDFYDLNGKIIFGEMTFYNASGYTEFEPDEFDFKLGEQFKIENVKEKNNGL